MVACKGFFTSSPNVARALSLLGEVVPAGNQPAGCRRCSDTCYWTVPDSPGKRPKRSAGSPECVAVRMNLPGLTGKPSLPTGNDRSITSPLRSWGVSRRRAPPGGFDRLGDDLEARQAKPGRTGWNCDRNPGRFA